MNNNILNQLKINELKGEDYIVLFPKEIEDMGYHFCSDIMSALQMSFPQKKFLGLPEKINFKDFTTEEIKELITYLQEEIDERNGKNK